MRCEKEQLADGRALPLTQVLLCWLVLVAMQPKMEGGGELQGPLLTPAVSEMWTTLAQSLGLALHLHCFSVSSFLCLRRRFIHDNRIKKNFNHRWGFFQL